jgi:hypothetical protein
MVDIQEVQLAADAWSSAHASRHVRDFQVYKSNVELMTSLPFNFIFIKNVEASPCEA